MAVTNKPLTAKTSVGAWLHHPVGGPLIRKLLAEGGVEESSLKPASILTLQRLVSLSKGQLSQEAVDGLVLAANGGTFLSEIQATEETVVEERQPVNLRMIGPEVPFLSGVEKIANPITRHGRTLTLSGCPTNETTPS